MAEDKLQFDDQIGGDQQLPQEINIMKFVTARSQEIIALSEAIDDPVRTGLVFQQIPKHMRRRIMSHNIKRLPRNLREAHQNQLEKCGSAIEKTNRPSRKYRRRPIVLLQEYNRRQKLFIWLETHIWHAKRFHMINKWGYKIPNYPNDKNFRACYRATSKHCLMQDISYYVCIELQGLEEDILAGLTTLTNPDSGLTFSAKYFLNGGREGKIILFKSGMYPFGVIGHVNFLWRSEVIKNKRKLWIWIHPSIYAEVLHEMLNIFNLKLDKNEEIMDIDSDLLYNCEINISKNTELEKLGHDHDLSSKVLRYGSSTTSVEMVLLENVLNRFSLTGPLSQAILTEAFHLIDMNRIRKQNDTNFLFNKCQWVLDCYESKELLTCFNEQEVFWEKMKNVSSPNQLLPHLVLPLTIVDPRLHMPRQKTKAVNEIDGYDAMSILKPPPNLSSGSPIWESRWRNHSSLNKASTIELNTIRSNSVVSGLSDDEIVRCGGPTNVSCLPILLIQKPGIQGSENNKRGYGCGWDVILPAGWAMPVWLSLIFRGARAGGLREADHLALEMGTELILTPDSTAGQIEEISRKNNDLENYFKLPPSKRPNYIKLGIVSPFYCCWNLLLKDWSDDPGRDINSFYILRHRNKLQLISMILNKKNTNSQLEVLHQINKILSPEDKVLSLLPVNIKLCGKGRLGKCATICFPSARDLQIFKTDRKYRGPIEHTHKDINEPKRKELRSAHMEKLKKLKKKRAKIKKLMNVSGQDFNGKKENTKYCSKNIIKDQVRKMNELWLPNNINNIKESCSREVIGFVTSGDFTFTEAKVQGQGFVVTSAIMKYLHQLHSCNNIVLTRVTDSYQYSFAEMKISLL